MLWQGDWTIEVIVKRSQLVDGTQFTCFTGTKVRILTQKALLGCAVSVLLGTSEFALSLDQAKGDPGENPQFTCCTRTKVQMLTDSNARLPGAIQILDYTTTRAGTAGKPNVWSFGACCPVDCWMLIALVRENGGTSVYIDGCKAGSIPKHFPLALTSVGASARNPQ